MANFTNDEINLVMEKRGCNRKSASQWLRRQKSPVSGNPAEQGMMAAKLDNLKAAAEAKAQPKTVAAQQPQVEQPKAAKPARKPAAPKTDDAPVPPSKPEVEFQLKQVEGVKGAFTSVVHGRKAIVCFIERDRASAGKRFNSLTYGSSRIADAQKAAKAAGLPIFYGAQVKVNGRWNGGWLIRAEVAQIHVVAPQDFRLGSPARIAYAADSQSYAGGCRFEIHEAQ